jgi:hypothetical protein
MGVLSRMGYGVYENPNRSQAYVKAQSRLVLMPLYAHALIELEDGTRYQRGETVPEDVDGIEELMEAGSVSEAEYDPAADVSPAPEVVEIDGVKYVKASDGAEAEDVRS